MYCTSCDDYGHATEDHEVRGHHPNYSCLCKPCRNLKFSSHDVSSRSQIRRLQVVKGNDWWIDEKSEPNGIGPICLFCKKLIDWAPRDHAEACPVRTYINNDEEPPDWT